MRYFRALAYVPPPQVRVDQATSVRSAASRVLPAPVDSASRVPAASPTPESFEPRGERGRRGGYNPSDHQGAPSWREAKAVFLLHDEGMRGCLSKCEFGWLA